MTLCLDIHTHHPAPQPLGVISATMDNFSPVEGQLYSVGIHPWDTNTMPGLAEWEKFENIVSLPCVVAIGECGIDKTKGGLLFKQMLIFNRQIELSEKLGKPLIIHDVKAHDIIVGLRKDTEVKQNWVVHGFRGKPTVAKMLTDTGIYLSFGEKYNPAAFPMVPMDKILAETDESPLSIEEIITNLSKDIYGEGEESVKLTTDLIRVNTQRFLYNEV